MHVSLLALLFAVNGWAAQAWVNGASGFYSAGGAGVASLSTSGTFSVSASNLLVCNLYVYPSTSVTVTDHGGDTFTQSISDTAGVIGGTSAQFRAPNTSADASEVVTLTFGSNAGFTWLACDQYSGSDTSSPYDVSAAGNGTSACFAGSVTAGPLNTTQPNEVINAGIILNTADASPFAGTGFTLRTSTSDNRFWTTDNIVSSTGSYTASFGTNHCDSWRMTAGTYIQAPAAGTDPPPQPFVIR